MPRGRGNFEKSKDFKGSITKIFKSLKPWHMVISISIILAMVSAIISLIAPNKLSDLTDYITEGLKPQVTEETFVEIMNDQSIGNYSKSSN